MKKIVSLLLTLLMLTTISVTAFADETSGEKQYSDSGYIYTDFSEITDINNLEAGKNYMFCSESFSKDQYLYELPQNAAYLYYCGSTFDKTAFNNDGLKSAFKTSLKNSYEKACANRGKNIQEYVNEGSTLEDATAYVDEEINNYKERYENETKLNAYIAGQLDRFDNKIGSTTAKFYKENYDQGYVSVINRGEAFDSCIMGAIGYLQAGSPIKTLDENNYSWSDGTAPETAWYYACNGGGVAYVGPYHVYDVTCYTITQDNIVVRAKSDVNLSNNTTLTKDQIEVFVNVGGREIKISDFDFVNPTITDGKIVVAVAGVKSTVTVAEKSPKTSDNNIAVSIAAFVSIVSLGFVLVSTKKVLSK